MLSCQRHLFDLPDDVAYLNCAYTSPLLRRASEAGRQAVQTKSSPWSITSGDFFLHMQRNRELFAELVGGDADQVAIIPSVSYGIALAARNIPLRAEQNIVLLQDQFPSNVYSWGRRARETRVEIRTVARPEDHDWTSAVLDAIDHTTAVAALPHCHWTDGTLLDLEAIGEKCRSVDAALVVDGTQSLGALPFSVPSIQPDFLVTTAHKWLLGPYSYGFCYVKPRWSQGLPLEENWLNREGSEDFTRLVDYRDGYQPGARRFDAGEGSNFMLAPIAREALRQILEWKVPAISETLRGKTRTVADRAQALGLQVAEEKYRAPHMIGLHLPGGFPRELPSLLAKEKVFVSVRGSSIRVAPHLYNTEQDIDRFFATLAKVLRVNSAGQN
jgi:selenocysteine lyase/cysteine desulfurase